MGFSGYYTATFQIHTLELSQLISVIQSHCPVPLRLKSFPPFANTEGRNCKMCFLKGRRGGKSPSCPEDHCCPTRAAATGLSAEAAKVPREGSECQLKQGSFSSLWAGQPPMRACAGLPEGSLQLEHFE